MTLTTVAPLSAADTAAIRTSGDQFCTLVVRQEFEALGGLYTEDTVLMPPHQPAVHGRAAVRTWMAAFPQITQFEFEIDEIDGRVDLAYMRGRYSMTFRPEGASAPVSDRGKFIEIRKRQVDGSWLIAADIFNSDNA